MLACQTLLTASSKGKAPPVFITHDGFVIHNRSNYLGSNSRLIPLLLHDFHDTPAVGQCGVKWMLASLVIQFFWKTMHKDVREYVAKCLVCQQTKYSTQALAGLLQPLPLPNAI